MEDLAPAYQFLLNVRIGIEEGEMLRQQIQCALEFGASDFHRDLRRWSLSVEQGTTVYWPDNIYRQALFQILGQGLRGQPIHNALRELEEEFEAAAKDDIERHLQLLPIQMLVPMLLFQFPAFLLILLGPLLSDLIEKISA